MKKEMRKASLIAVTDHRSCRYEETVFCNSDELRAEQIRLFLMQDATSVRKGDV